MMTGAYQTRICEYANVSRCHGDAALSAYAELYGRVERKLFAEVSAGRTSASLKSEYLKWYGIPARMFNAVRVLLEGKIASVREQQKLRLDGLRRRIARAETQIVQAEQRGRLNQAHHKRRRLANMRHRLTALEADMTADRVRLCFGSKRLWRQQYHLQVNGYDSHAEWRSGWPTGVLPAATSSSCWVVVMRRRVARCAWPESRTMAP